MADNRGRVIPVAIEDEVKDSYLNYAMSVIISRALPDVRDGLKPVHRRILYAMNEMGLRSDRPTRKCARIVGDVLGKYHPHGDLSVYDALVRMAQDFSMRNILVQGQGNYGSIDGDPPAAMRYTEARLTKLAEEMLRDIRKETVDFGPNYDDSTDEPLVLPAAVPNLLVNGASGIAVGMATNMPTHNLKEVAAAVIAYIDDHDISLEALMKHVSGPDFPTSGIIFGKKGIRDAYKTGRGKIPVRARCTIESNKKGRDVVIVTEIPYAVNKSTLIVRIADLVRDKKIEGITDLRDESDRDGIRIVIELKRGVSPKIILNQLFSMTQLQVNFNVNALALVDGKPETLTLKRIIECFVEHRREVIIRRTEFDLKRAEEREHILEGLKIALENIDEVIELIKKSENVDTARTGLMKRFKLSEKQAQAILDMRLQKLTSLETQKIIDELEEVRALIKELRSLLASETKILEVIKDETRQIAEKFGDDRKTEIVHDEIEEIDIEDLIQKEDMVVLFSHRGFTKRVPLSSYRRQGRGGKGSTSVNLRDEDFIEDVFIASTHDYLLFLTSEGKAYWLKVHEIPEGSRTSRGQHIKSLLQISTDEEIAAVVPLQDFTDDNFIVMGTSMGMIKKVQTSDFSNARTRGIIAVNLKKGDRLVMALLTSGNDEVMLVTRKGSGLRFHEENVRPTGRTSRGVLGIRLTKGDELLGLVCIDMNKKLMLISEFGYGKRTDYSEFHPHGRGTKGQMAYRVSEKTGELAGVLSVLESDDIVVMTSQGNMIKLRTKEVTEYGRQAVGVRIVNIVKPDSVVGMDRAAKEEE